MEVNIYDSGYNDMSMVDYNEVMDYGDEEIQDIEYGDKDNPEWINVDVEEKEFVKQISTLSRL